MHAFFDFIAVFPLGHCDIKIALQIQPEVGGIAEIAPSLKAVLADIKRLPFKISVMRPEGTPTGMDAMSRRLDAIMAVQYVAMLVRPAPGGMIDGAFMMLLKVKLGINLVAFVPHHDPGHHS